MQQFDKIDDVAMELLDAAVSEHLDHARHFAAYNLAAVAEELLFKFVRLAGKKDSSEIKIGMVKEISKALGQCKGNDQTWGKEFFRLKNTIKHVDHESDRHFEANIETNARQKIGDAISNLEKLNLAKSSDVCRFDRYRLSLKPKNPL